MKNKLILLTSVLIGIIAFWLSKAYLDNEYDKLYGRFQTIEVVGVKNTLPAGTVLKREDLQPMKVPDVGQSPVRAEDVNRVIGRRIFYRVDEGKALLWSNVDAPRLSGSEFARKITEGKRALSINLSGASAVSGLVQPNDHVDLIGTFTFPDPLDSLQTQTKTLTLLQNVLVLATGTQYGQYTTASAGGYSTVTFELTPEEVEIVVFAQQERGQLYTSLRNPDDIVIDDRQLPSVNFSYLEGVIQELNDMRIRSQKNQE
ncbi:MAG: Flp pilus assembly protein CpaB [Pontiellaceae bacterium]|nr:Flp pilus assembly protein CpaB [Pontiellaceae bacterium]